MERRRKPANGSFRLGQYRRPIERREVQQEHRADRLRIRCNVLTSLIDSRDLKPHVKAIANVVGYDEMPQVSIRSDLEKKKWYHRRSLVLCRRTTVTCSTVAMLRL